MEDLKSIGQDDQSSLKHNEEKNPKNKKWSYIIGALVIVLGVGAYLFTGTDLFKGFIGIETKDLDECLEYSADEIHVGDSVKFTVKEGCKVEFAVDKEYGELSVRGQDDDTTEETISVNITSDPEADLIDESKLDATLNATVGDTITFTNHIVQLGAEVSAWQWNYDQEKLECGDKVPVDPASDFICTVIAEGESQVSLAVWLTMKGDAANRLQMISNLITVVGSGKEVVEEEVEEETTAAESHSYITSLKATALDSTVHLKWTEKDDTGVKGYTIYYGLSSVTAPGQKYDFNIDVGNNLEYTITGLENGITYYFSVVAYDEAGNESSIWAPEASATPSAASQEETIVETITIEEITIADAEEALETAARILEKAKVEVEISENVGSTLESAINALEKALAALNAALGKARDQDVINAIRLAIEEVEEALNAARAANDTEPAEDTEDAEEEITTEDPKTEDAKKIEEATTGGGASIILPNVIPAGETPKKGAKNAGKTSVFQFQVNSPATGLTQSTVGSAKPAVRPTGPAVFQVNSPATGLTQSTSPATQPTSPATQPTSPATQPTSPATQPTSQTVGPAEPAVEPTKPAVGPAEPTVEPTKPAVKPSKEETPENEAEKTTDNEIPAYYANLNGVAGLINPILAEEGDTVTIKGIKAGEKVFHIRFNGQQWNLDILEKVEGEEDVEEEEEAVTPDSILAAMEKDGDICALAKQPEVNIKVVSDGYNSFVTLKEYVVKAGESVEIEDPTVEEDENYNIYHLYQEPDQGTLKADEVLSYKANENYKGEDSLILVPSQRFGLQILIEDGYKDSVKKVLEKGGMTVIERENEIADEGTNLEGVESGDILGVLIVEDVNLEEAEKVSQEIEKLLVEEKIDDDTIKDIGVILPSYSEGGEAFDESDFEGTINHINLYCFSEAVPAGDDDGDDGDDDDDAAIITTTTTPIDTQPIVTAPPSGGGGDNIVPSAPTGGGGGGGGGGGLIIHRKKASESTPVKTGKVETKKITDILNCLSESKTAIDFKDTNDTAVESLTKIEYLKKPIFEGYREGNKRIFNGNDYTTRAQIVKVFMVSNCKPFNIADKSTFADVPETEWFFDYIESAKKLGVVQGYENNQFKPNQEVTVAEAIKILSMIAGIDEAPDSCKEKPFADINKEHWAFEITRDAYCEGIIPGRKVEQSTFLYPDKLLTRYEMAILINNYYVALAEKEK